jgi:hypothetical protein
MEDNIRKAKVNAREIIENLQVLYGEKFSKMYGEISPKALEIWRGSLGGYDEFVGKIALQRILDGKTKHTVNVPTLPQLKSLFNEIYFELNNHERSKRLQSTIEHNRDSGIDLIKKRDLGDDKVIMERFCKGEVMNLSTLKGREYCFKRMEMLSQINPRLNAFVKILRKNDNVECVA